jgi:hypothetical protein
VPQWFNGICSPESELRQNVAQNSAQLVDKLKATAAYAEFVSVRSEAKDDEQDFASDETTIFFLVRLVAASSTKNIDKKKVIDDLAVGGFINALSSGFSYLGSPVTIPSGAVTAFVPYGQAAAPTDSSIFVLDYKFRFGDDEEKEDAARDRKHISHVKVTLKLSGGFKCSDDDGDSFVHVKATLSSGQQNIDYIQVNVFGEPGKDAQNPSHIGSHPLSSGTPAAKPATSTPGSMNWYGLNLKVEPYGPQGGQVEQNKDYKFHGTLTIDVPTEKKSALPLVVNVSVNAGAVSDHSVIVTSDNSTVAWVNPLELVLTPSHSG